MEIYLDESTVGKDFQHLVELTAKAHGGVSAPAPTQNILWNENFFQLAGTTLWGKLNQEQRLRVLHNLNQSVLQEAYFIECAGMAYAAKMNLAAKTLEEREFFCFMAEEEARHLRSIQGLGLFSTAVKDVPSFSRFIGQIIDQGTKSSHLLSIQILLEGWGIQHYKSLTQATECLRTKEVFTKILKDETRHHSAGVLLYDIYRDEKIEHEILQFLKPLLHMVQIGPFGVCAAMFDEMKGLTPMQIEQLYFEMNSESVTQTKLDYLQRLLSKNIHFAVPAEMFKALTSQGMAAFFAKTVQLLPNPQADTAL